MWERIMTSDYIFKTQMQLFQSLWAIIFIATVVIWRQLLPVTFNYLALQGVFHVYVKDPIHFMGNFMEIRIVNALRHLTSSKVLKRLTCI